MQVLLKGAEVKYIGTHLENKGSLHSDADFFLDYINGHVRHPDPAWTKERSFTELLRTLRNLNGTLLKEKK